MHEPGTSEDPVQTRSQARDQGGRPDAAAGSRRARPNGAAQGAMHVQIAAALGIVPEELIELRAEGATLAEIAAQLGVEIDALPVGPAQAGKGPNAGGAQARGPQGAIGRQAGRGSRF